MLPETLRPIIEGELPDLVFAVDYTASSDDRLIRADDEYRLESDDFDGLADLHELERIARSKLEVINVACSLASSSYRPISLSDRYHSLTGDVSVMGAVATVVIRASGTATGHVNGVVVPPSEPDLLRVTRTNTDVAKAGRWLAERPQSWVSLWKAYDVVKEATGVRGFNRMGITDAGWATMAELDSFERSANDESVSGDAARHAKTIAKRKGSPMALNEGVDLIRRIVRRWAESLI